jgi:hypothetical protein
MIVVTNDVIFKDTSSEQEKEVVLVRCRSRLRSITPMLPGSGLIVVGDPVQCRTSQEKEFLCIIV